MQESDKYQDLSDSRAVSPSVLSHKILHTVELIKQSMFSGRDSGRSLLKRVFDLSLSRRTPCKIMMCEMSWDNTGPSRQEKASKALILRSALVCCLSCHSFAFMYEVKA
jgi:hypothetical protein